MLAQREQLNTTILRYFEENGIAALTFPPTRIPAPKIGEETEVDIAGQKVPMAAAMARNVALGSCASMASLVLPAGLTANGLPIGMEFAGLSGTDREILALSTIARKSSGTDSSAEGVVPFEAAADFSYGSFATDRWAPKIASCPQCPESDGWPSERRPSRWANRRQRSFLEAIGGEGT
jgi:hypothetical protein